jgi:hypothetical protein
MSGMGSGKWIRPIQAVFQREVIYAYGHPAMSVEQVKSQWTGIANPSAAASDCPLLP